MTEALFQLNNSPVLFPSTPGNHHPWVEPRDLCFYGPLTSLTSCPPGSSMSLQISRCVSAQFPLTQSWMNLNSNVTHSCSRIIKQNILLSNRRKWHWAICGDVDETRVCHTEWSKTEREKQTSYINAYMWNLEKRHWRMYLQGRSRDAGAENGLVGTVGEGESGTDWENSTHIDTLSCVK